MQMSYVDTTGDTITDTEALKSFVKSVFEKLDRASIRYCVFRDYNQIEVPEESKEIDLLVDPRDMKKLGDLLAKNGFAPLPSWGHEPHNFFVTYNKSLGMWLKLDVITALRFGKPVSALELDFTSSYLTNRTRREIAFVPTTEDKFLVLLLKCIINDKKFNDVRKARLQEMFMEIHEDPFARERLEKNLTKYLPGILDWPAIAAAFQSQQPEQLLATRKAIRQRLFRQAPLAVMGRHVHTRLMKRISPLLFMMKHHGISVALLAPDGGGKSTLAKSLIAQRHLNARFIYMGENQKASNIGLPTTPWFKKKKKQKGKNPLEKILVGIFNFPNTLLEQWYRLSVSFYYRYRGRSVIFDRYIYDAWLNPRKKSLVKKVRRLLVEGTYPTPDLVLFLDAPGEVLFARKGEHNPEWLESKRQAYLALQRQLPNMLVLDATQSPQKVQKEAIDLLWKFYRTRDLRKTLNGKHGNTHESEKAEKGRL